MPPPDRVADYLARLDGALRFDRMLADRVHAELEDHLAEALDADPVGTEAERAGRAIAALGDPRALARDYAALAALRQTRRAGAMVVIATAGIFLGMRARVYWLAATPVAMSAGLHGLARLTWAIDCSAFIGAFALGILGWGWLSARGAVLSTDAGARRRLQGSLLLSAGAAAALVLSVLADMTMATLRLRDIGLTTAIAVPLLSIAVEVALAALLVRDVGKARRRALMLSALR